MFGFGKKKGIEMDFPELPKMNDPNLTEKAREATAQIKAITERIKADTLKNQAERREQNLKETSKKFRLRIGNRLRKTG